MATNLAIGALSTGPLIAYVIGLVISGLLLVVFGAVGVGRQGVGLRVINVLVGLAMLGYAFWIFFLSNPGDTIRIFFYVFIVPIALIVQAVRNRRATS